jgi:hypothetical protein
MVYGGIDATNWNRFMVVDISSRQLLLQNSGSQSSSDSGYFIDRYSSYLWVSKFNP